MCFPLVLLPLGNSGEGAGGELRPCRSRPGPPPLLPSHICHPVPRGTPGGTSRERLKQGCPRRAPSPPNRCPWTVKMTPETLSRAPRKQLCSKTASVQETSVFTIGSSGNLFGHFACQNDAPGTQKARAGKQPRKNGEKVVRGVAKRPPKRDNGMTKTPPKVTLGPLRRPGGCRGTPQRLPGHPPDRK